MSGGRWAGDNEIQRGEDGHAGCTRRWRSTSINGSKASSVQGLGKSWVSWDTAVSSSHHIPGLSPALLQVSNQTQFFHDAQPAQGSRSPQLWPHSVNILNAPSLRTAAGQQKLPSGVESGSGCPSPRCCVWIPLPPTPSAAHTLPATFGAKDTGICYDFCIRQSGTLPASGSLVAHFLLILPTPPKSSQCRRDHA